MIVFKMHHVHEHNILTFELSYVVPWLNFAALASKMYFTWINYKF